MSFAMDDILGYLTALGLSTAAGLNAWIPLLATAALARWTSVIDLDGNWDVLTQTPVMIGLLGVAILDFVGDKIPAVDHGLHAAGTVIAPATGIIAALASTSGLDVSPALLTVIGLVSAETAHGTRMAIRPFSTATTGGAGNPVLSAVEDVVSFVLSFAAIIVPVLAALLVLALFAGAWVLIRRLRRRLAARAAPAAPA
jgi:hypothetical protein